MLISVLYPEQDAQVKEIPEGGLLVGRGSFCDIILTDEYVSIRHCKVFLENGEVFIEDLGSTNGTLVDGEKIEKKSGLKAGQSIHIGISVLKIS